MALRLRPAVRSYITHCIGDRPMVETVTTHGVRHLDNGSDLFLEGQPYCIATPQGLSVCGRTSLRLLPHLRLAHCADQDVCPECMNDMLYLWMRLSRAEQNRWAKTRSLVKR